MPKSKITKAEFDALEPDAKASYELAGESAYFTGEIPDVTSLQTALQSERTMRENAEKAIKPYAGIDPVKAKEALAAQTKQATGKEPDLTTKEGLQAALDQMRTDFDQKFKAKETEANQLITDRTIESVLVKAGVIPEAMPDAMDAVRKLVKPLGDDPAQLGVIGPTGTFIGTPFDAWAATDLKKTKSWFFADNGVGGTGSKVGTRGVDTTGATVKVDRQASKENPALYRQAKEQAAKSGATVDLGAPAAA